MKVQFISGLLIGASLSMLVSLTQDFVLPKKEKKPSVSPQQCAQALGDYIHLLPDIITHCSALLSLCAHAQKYALGHIDDYIEGNKNGLHLWTKSHRTSCYDKILIQYTELQELQDKLITFHTMLEDHCSTLCSFNKDKK